jgi:hypothetical protein
VWDWEVTESEELEEGLVLGGGVSEGEGEGEGAGVEVICGSFGPTSIGGLSGAFGLD